MISGVQLFTEWALMSERPSSSRWWNISIFVKLHCWIAVQVKKDSNLMFSFLNGRNAWEFSSCWQFLCAPRGLFPLSPLKLCWFRERSANTGSRTPSAMFLSLLWLFPFSARFLEGCEPSLTAAGFCNVGFMEAHVLPAVPTASDTLQMLLRAVGLNRQPELLSPTFCWTKHLSQAQSPLCWGLPRWWGSCCASPRLWTAARSLCSPGRWWGTQRASGAGAWRKAGSGAGPGGLGTIPHTRRGRNICLLLCLLQ